MFLDCKKRFARMGIRELAEFSLLRTRGGTAGIGRWRLESGQRWHQTLQREVESSHLSERKIVATLRQNGWTVELEGRVDLCQTGGDGTPVEVGEIKTVIEPLPVDASYLRERYPAYFRQAAAYAHFLQEEYQLSERIRSYLLFVDIDSGFRQQVDIEVFDIQDLEKQIEAVLHFLEQLRTRYRERRKISFPSMLRQPRPGQLEVAQWLRQAWDKAPFIAFQAPTGFGKTRLLWEIALGHLREGTVDRILYLTVKNSGQEQAVKEWSQLFPAKNGPVFYRMRNHPEHHKICPLAGCQERSCKPDRVGERITSVEESLYHLTNGHPEKVEEIAPLEDPLWRGLSQMAQREHFCPYDLSRSMLPLADVWVADLNYLFSPGSRHLFLEQPGFRPERTLLLVDEAHNLADRVESALSIRMFAEDWEDCEEELRQLQLSPRLRRVLREMRHWTESQEEGFVLGPSERYQILDSLEAALPLLESETILWRELSEMATETLQSLPLLYQLLEDEHLHPVLWRPKKNCLEVVPLESASWIRSTLSGFYKTVFFSATLDPMHDFAEKAGIPEEQWQSVTGDGFSTGCFRVAIDVSVDTRLKARDKYYGVTAHTAARMREYSQQCVVVFFPSRKYADAVRLYMEVDHPHLRVAVQPTGTGREQVEEFLQSAVHRYDLLFLLLGGVYAEGIDTLGGSIDSALIVGTGLPEMNALTRCKMDRYDNREEGFDKVCRIPGMRRVNQAMGRLVRDPSHRATILLQDERFQQESYRQLLRGDLGEIPVLKSDQQVAHWLGDQS